MARKSKLARCRRCDLLIPISQQLGLRSHLYCYFPDHWQLAGYEVADIEKGLEDYRRRGEQMFREACNALIATLNRCEDTHEKDQRGTQKRAADESMQPSSPHDAQVEQRCRHMLGWLDKDNK